MSEPGTTKEINNVPTFSIASAARAIGCTRKTVYRACYKGLAGATRVTGKNGPCWRLTQESIDAIDLTYKPFIGGVVEETARRFKDGESVEALTRDYGVKRESIVKRLNRAGCSVRITCEA
jgi:hypothetical protein